MNIKFKSIIYIFFVVLFVSQVYSIKYSFEEQTCGNVDCVEVVPGRIIGETSTLHIVSEIFSNQITNLDYIDINNKLKGIRTKDDSSYCIYFLGHEYQYECFFVQRPKIEIKNKDLELLKDYNIEDVCSCADNDIKEFNLTINGVKVNNPFKLEFLKKYEFNCSCEDKIGQTASETFEVDHTTYNPNSITDISKTNGYEISISLDEQLSKDDFCGEQENCEIKNLENDEIIKTDSLDYKIKIEKGKLYCFEFNYKKKCFINIEETRSIEVDSYSIKINQLKDNDNNNINSLFYIDNSVSPNKIIYKAGTEDIVLKYSERYFFITNEGIKSVTVNLGDIIPDLNKSMSLVMFHEYDIEDTCKCVDELGSTRKLTINDRNVEEKYTFYSLGKYKFKCSCTLDYKEEFEEGNYVLDSYRADNLKIINEEILKDSKFIILDSTKIIIRDYFKLNSENTNYSIKEIETQKEFYSMKDNENYDLSIIIEKGKLYCFEDLHDSNQKKCFVYPEEKTINSNKDKINIEEIKIDGKSLIYLNTSDLVYKNNKYYEGNIEFNPTGLIEIFNNQNYLFLQNTEKKIYNASFTIGLIPEGFDNSCELHEIGRYKLVDNQKYKLKNKDGEEIDSYEIKKGENTYVIFSSFLPEEYVLRKCFIGIDLVDEITHTNIYNITEVSLVAQKVFDTQYNLNGIVELIRRISVYVLAQTEYVKTYPERSEKLIKDLSPEYLIELKNILNQIKSITAVKEIQR